MCDSIRVNSMYDQTIAIALVSVTFTNTHTINKYYDNI